MNEEVIIAAIIKHDRLVEYHHISLAIIVFAIALAIFFYSPYTLSFMAFTVLASGYIKIRENDQANYLYHLLTLLMEEEDNV